MKKLTAEARPLCSSSSLSTLSFSTARRRRGNWPLPSATLEQALSRQALVYPLATLVVSGQWPMFARAPDLTRAIRQNSARD